MWKRALPLSILLGAWPAAAQAQLISIRSVPISQSHQFDIFPSYTLAMGGVSIAVNDTLLDPFSNPATGTRVGPGRMFSTPSVYGVSSGAGAGRTLPLGGLTKTGSWFAGVSLALQEVDLSDNARFGVTPFPCPACSDLGIEFGPNELSHGNTHVFAMAGRDVGAGVALAASVLWSDLNAVDGVDLLYANNAQINQYGHSIDLRLGMLKQWDGGPTLEALVLHNRYGMTHDVGYLDPFWDPGSQQFSQRPRVEHNLDRTNTWGLHVEYDRPIATAGWRVGLLATANRMSHPKIPNYEIMNIPRDPGNSTAFNLGAGISKTRGGSTFGMDVIYEPIRSHTWADSEDPIETARGDTIAPGGMTIENRFRFSNALFRMGFDQQQEFGESGPMGGIQFGLAVRGIDYRLNQQNHVMISARSLAEQWVEWTPTWGVRIRFPELEIGYRGSMTSGTGRPGVFPDGGIVFAHAAAVAPAGNILVAPSGPLTLTDVRVTTHQFSVSIPIR